MSLETLINWSEYALGKTDEQLALEFQKDNIDATLHLVQQATHSLQIYNYDLEPSVFNTSKFIDAVRSVATKSKYSIVQILVSNPESMIKDGHLLLELSRRLSDSIEIRQVASEFQNHIETYLIVDETGYLFRSDSSRYEGSANFSSPGQSKKHLNDFSIIWAQSKSIPDFNRLHI